MLLAEKSERVEKIALIAEILKLKQEKNAVILAHNYQIPEIQNLADYVGDSLGLAYKARDADADVIAFCGVHFMAETAKIVNPNKVVVLPDKDAGCSLEQACPGSELKNFLQKNEDKNYYVVAYINCSAEVKAIADVICTSGNAEKIVSKIPADRNILFVPDRHLGSWVMEKTGRHMDLWGGSCYVHIDFRTEIIEQMKEHYPKAKVIAHPECVKDVRRVADIVCSTEKMVTFCKDDTAEEFIIITESGMLHRLRREIPTKKFYAYATESNVFQPCPTEGSLCADCKYMKMNTLDKLRDCLKNLRPQINLEENLRQKAEKSISLMLDWSA